MLYISKKKNKSYQKKSNSVFSKLLIDRGGLDASGRPTNTKVSYKLIFDDILNKLKISNKSSVLDIGCGAGVLVNMIINLSKKKELNLTLNDTLATINFLKNKYKNYNTKKINFVSGMFQNTKLNKKFDFILIYSVIHYIDKPLQFLAKAFKLLKTNGKILIGDIPNINKKARFSISQQGRAFNKKYYKEKINRIKKYHNYKNFFEKNKHLRRDIDDRFVYKIAKIYRNKYCNVYILDQNKGLPFCFTREDVLIEKLK